MTDPAGNNVIVSFSHADLSELLEGLPASAIAEGLEQEDAHDQLEQLEERSVASHHSGTQSVGTHSVSSCGSSTTSDADSSLMRNRTPWTPAEDLAIEEGVRAFGCKWSRIAALLPSERTDDAVRHRWQRLKRRRDREQTVREPVPRRSESASSNDERGKHRDYWTPEEDRIIDMCVREQGLKWSAISDLLPGRTESGCRQRWVRNQEKRLIAQGGAAGSSAALDGWRGAAGQPPSQYPTDPQQLEGHYGAAQGLAQLDAQGMIAPHHRTLPASGDLDPSMYHGGGHAQLGAASQHLISPPFEGVVAAHTQAAASSYNAAAYNAAAMQAAPPGYYGGAACGGAAPGEAYGEAPRGPSPYNPCASGVSSGLSAMSLGPS